MMDKGDDLAGYLLDFEMLIVNFAMVRLATAGGANLLWI